MNTLQSRTRLIVWIVIIVVIVGIFVFFWMHGSGSPAAGTAGTNSTSSAGAENGALTTVTSTPTGGATEPSTGASAGSGSKSGSSAGAATNPSIITINLVTPISGNTWTIGQPNVIAWSQAAKVTGEIDLVNAQTKALVGVILSETGPNQTSYSWDARSIYAARYSAEQHDVVPGTYAIRIRFDGNGFGSLVSGPITITN